MLQSYNYQLNPNTFQKIFFNKSFGCVRFIYNWGLALKKDVYIKDNVNLSYADMCKYLTLLKKRPEYSFLNEVSSICLQQSLRNLDAAFQNFFKHRTKFPKFKSKHYSNNSYNILNRVDIDFDGRFIKLPKIGWVKFHANQIFKGRILSVTICKSHTDKYYVSIIVENEKELPIKSEIKLESTIGIDLGLKDFAVFSNGFKICNPRFYLEYDKKIKCLCRICSRKQKGSNRRKRIQYKINKLYERKRNLINNFLYHVTKQIYSENQTVIIEDLGVKNMMKNHKLSKSISEVCWGKFIRILKYKADWYGKNVIFIDRFEPSTKLCSNCNYKNNTLTLADRQWICPKCGVCHDRDVNAAVNIKTIGLNMIVFGKTEYSPVVNGFNGRGGGGNETGEASKCTIY